MKRILTAVLLLTLAGCSSFKVGAFCYLPHGQQGQCMLGSAPVQPATTEEKKL